jgi:XRE family transcriptional regulator, stress-response regulator
MSLLLREAIGASIRQVRTSQRRSLREVSRRARVSLGYLSEVERGRKEASSELLAAICDALGLPLSELLDDAAMMLRPVTILRVPIGTNHADLRLAESRRMPTPAGPRVANAA